MTGDCCQVATVEGLPPMAVPMTVKIPEPMTAPMPRAVMEMGPRDFLRAVSGISDSWMSLSMDLVAKICRARVLIPRRAEDDSISNDCMREQAGWRGQSQFVEVRRKSDDERRGLRSPLR